MRPESVDPQLIWTRYWRSGALHSCVTSYDGNYDGRVRAFWYSVFDALQAGDSCLDVGTGNGALPLMLLEWAGSRGLALRCAAIDLADIDPRSSLPSRAELLAQVDFRSNCSVERLPFEDASFALVTSQYAVEYADRGRSLAEIARVLHPGGRLAMLAHHGGSLLARVAEEEMAHCDLLLAEEGMLASAQRLMPYLALAATPDGVRRLRADPAAEATRQAFNQAAARTIETRNRAAVPDVLQQVPDQVGEILKAVPQIGAAAAGEALRRLGESVQDMRGRLDALCRCALDEAAVREFSEAARSAGLALERCEPLHHEDGALMAWAIEARRV